MQDDMFDLYLKMLVDSEAPNTFHRWSLMTVLGAWLGRRCWLQFGRGKIHCNMYTMLMGNAGSRKSSAIKEAVEFIKLAGYDSIAAEKTSKEKFLLDLAGDPTVILSEDILETNLFGEAAKSDAEVLIAADEFNVFVGNGNLEFLALLGTLWDYSGKFENKTKNSASAYIYNPTISMLAGNTSTSFALAFPIEAIGQGIFSRLLLIGGEKTGKKLTIPPQPDSIILEYLVGHLIRMKTVIQGEFTLSDMGFKLLDKIYKDNQGINDIRFESYNNRRLTHLIKLSLIISASELSMVVSEDTIIKANTILTHAEHSMPAALGQFGKAKNSDITNKILALLTEANPPIVPLKAIWRQVHNDLDNMEQLKNILSGLVLADKIMHNSEPLGFLAKMSHTKHSSKEVDFELLTEAERGSILL